MAVLPALLAAADNEPLIQRLDPKTRSQLMLALTFILLLGFIMLVLVWLGGRMVKRYAAWNRPLPGGRSSAPADEDDWCSKPLVTTDGPDE